MSKKLEIVSFNEEDYTNIRNLFTNTRLGVVRDRDQLIELLDDEDNFIEKMDTIQNKRDSLLAENKELLSKIKKLEKDVVKASK